MKTRLFLLICVALSLLTLPAWAETPNGKGLVAIIEPGTDGVARLTNDGVMVVREMNNYLLALAGPGDIETIQAGGFRWEELDSSIDGKTYFTVETWNRSDIESLRSAVRVLRFDGTSAVVEATQSELNGIINNRIEVAKVFMRPLRQAPDTGDPAGVRSRAADPAIQAMVDSVDITTFTGYVQRMQDFDTRYCTKDSCQAAADWIKATYESYGIDSVYFHQFHATYKDNVVAVIPGKGDPSKIVLIGGHYDSINSSNYDDAPGANDNATGTACAMECARILSQYDFNYTLVFMAFGGEEVGLYGSEGYASDAAAAGDDIIGAIAIDMIGYVAGGDALDLDIVDNVSSEWMRDLVFGVAADYVPELTLVDGAVPGGASSDHASFWANGYDAILFFEDSDDYSPFIHTSNDVVGVSYNSPVLAERSVKTAIALLATMAEPYTIGLTHTPLSDTETTGSPYEVRANITAAGTLDPDSLLVRYSTGGGWSTLTMTGTGTPDEYHAFIPGQAGGTFVDYFIVAEDMSGNRITHPGDAPAGYHTFFVGTILTLFEDDFETDLGWTVGDDGDDATTGVWERGDPEGTTYSGQLQPEDDHTTAPGVNCYVTGRLAGSSAGSYDVDGGKTTILSPVFDLSSYSAAGVSYWRWYSNNQGGAPGEDYWVVQVTDDGSEWVDLENTLESRNSWNEYSFRLDGTIDLTSTVQFRFIASDEIDGSLVEAALDDFSIYTYQMIDTDVADGSGGAPGRIALYRNTPNPFNPTTTLHFYLPERSDVAVRIYDIGGRLVRSVIDASLEPGDHQAVWNGTDDQSRPVGSGIYFCRLETNEFQTSRKLVLLK